MTKIADMRGKSQDELKDLVVTLKKELFNLRFRAASGDAPNTARFRQVRRDVARAKTLLNEPAGSVAVTKKAKAPKAMKADKAEKAEKAAPKAAKKTTSKKKASGE